ncbi:hypothetical protein BFW87_20145 [Pseudomonas fluorescens]|uniref:Uncharacterized protein n=1 Tax=Pseudomonas fluorescens TaxID=294 RepID=A0A1T2YGH1_PSEFL|nr:hypothetical protein [Pseudomonas fluorescens]OPA91320.1 hypothetical protein BFW87_20145 [Pseudomonas fluorescens]
MDTVFLQQTGIRPWDQLYPTEEQEYVTVSLLNQDFESVWKTWHALASLLTNDWPMIVMWYSTSYPSHSKTQEYITLKHFAKNSGPKDIFKKNEATLVYSGIEYLNQDPKHIDPAKLTSYSRSVTIMMKKDSQPESLWQRLSHLKYISTTDDFRLILKDNNDLTFRFYDAETHGVAQLICHSIHLKKLDNALNILKLRRIQQEGVYEYIHS